MKFIIEEDVFTYMVDWGKENKVVDGFLEEYHPSCQEALEAMMQLLTNIYPPEEIGDCLAKGVGSIDYIPCREQDEEE